MDKDFEKKVIKEYHELLNELTENGGQEQKIHEYFERRPLLLPGIYGVYESTNHGVFNELIFSKFQLNGAVIRRIPDFLFVTKTSVQLQVVFIEIEDPSKKIFTEKDNFTSEFNQAFQQLEDWDLWFKTGTNQNILREALNSIIDHPMMARLPIKTEYVLVYGRRSEFEDKNLRIQRLSQKNKYPFKIMSFDRLNCAPYTDTLMTVRLDQNGAYALQVDERYEYDYVTRSAHKKVRGKEEAVKQNEYMNANRKNEIVKRIEHLDSITDKQASREQFERTTLFKLSKRKSEREE